MPWAIGCIFVDLGKHKLPCYYCFLYTGKNHKEQSKGFLLSFMSQEHKGKAMWNVKEFPKSGHSVNVNILDRYEKKKPQRFLGTHVYHCSFSYLPDFIGAIKVGWNSEGECTFNKY